MVHKRWRGEATPSQASITIRTEGAITMLKEKEINCLNGKLGVTEKIKMAMYEAAKQFVYIGFLLWEVKQYHYYKLSGYQDVYDYAEKELNFKKSSTKNFIAVAETFGNKYYGQFNESYANLPTMSLKPEYKDFKYSQLVEMLAMSDTKRKQITPDMTIKQIREIKKEPEFALEPEYETMSSELPEPVQEPTTKGQTSDQKNKIDYDEEITITITRRDIDYIVNLLKEEISFWEKGSGEYDKPYELKIFLEYQINN